MKKFLEMLKKDVLLLDIQWGRFHIYLNIELKKKTKMHIVAVVGTAGVMFAAVSGFEEPQLPEPDIKTEVVSPEVKPIEEPKKEEPAKAEAPKKEEELNMVNIDKAINYMNQLGARGVTYSMNGSRTGEDGTADCSGAIYAALRQGGASDAGWILNTDSMHSWLEQNNFNLIAHNKEWNMNKGDIIIFGTKGASGGAAGHVVMAVDSTNIIDCAWYGSENVPAVRVRPETQLPYSMGWYVYRQPGNKPAPAPTPTGWVPEKATFTLTENGVNLRDAPVNGNIIAVLNAGNSVKYDAYKIIGNQVWCRQPRIKGYGYICVRQDGRPWGTFA